ncbi:aldo/keto reductase, partial [Streptomyces sp. NPDC051940]|uniref:aldo/keto reductase n=1 Tax=Streptomyces sp. NPDC051940 TaxID=3155675 RepID=UPI003443EC07
ITTSGTPAADCAASARPTSSITGDGQRPKRCTRAHDASVAEVRLAWTLQQGPHVLAIPGTGDPDHLAQNMAAGALRLSEEETARLTALRPADA